MVGYYTEILFPEKDVRFIAINNSIDSATPTDNDFTPFLNIMNEWYAKDTSKKIKAIFQSRMKSGKRCSGAIPYGYKHDPEDKNHLLVDEEAAKDWLSKGAQPTDTVARLLKNAGIEK